MDSVSVKDIATAAMGGSAAIAGVLLVFVGFMIIKAEAIPSEAPDRIARKYILAAKLGLVPILAQTAVILSSYLWLFNPASKVLLRGWSIGFPISLVLFVIYSAATTLML